LSSFDEQEIFSKNFSVAFIALHGIGGEDGKIQSILSKRGIRYTGSGAESCKLTFDKSITKEIFKTNGIKTPLFEIVSKDSTYDLGKLKLNYPLIIKPTNEGSSIGIFKAYNLNDLEKAIQELFKYYEKLVIEEYILGKELTVSFLDGEILPSIEIITRDGDYNFDAKYNRVDNEYICPAKLETTKWEELKSLSLKAFNICKCVGWARLDLIFSKNQFYILEINSVPGLTSHSLFPMSAKKIGKDFDDLVLDILCSSKYEKD
jgi:D-alanine-D-alanine ligase